MTLSKSTPNMYCAGWFKFQVSFIASQRFQPVFILKRGKIMNLNEKNFFYAIDKVYFLCNYVYAIVFDGCCY